MRPQRTQKRARYAESSSPLPETNIESPVANSESIMQPGDQHQAKRPRGNSQLPSNQGQFNTIRGIPLALPQAIHVPAQNTPSAFMQPDSLRAQLSSPSNVMIQSPSESIASPQPSNLRLAGHPIETAGIAIPSNLTSQEYRRRREDMRYEIEYRRSHAPALPRSIIADLPPKPPSEPWVPFPDDVTEEMTERIMAENNRISAEMQKVDRERNNLAAKKSRQKRLEALGNTRKILNDCFVELGWWKLKAISMGASANEYRAVSQSIKDSALNEVERDVKEIDDVNDKFRKEEESRRRAERNRARAQAKKEAMRNMSPED